MVKLPAADSELRGSVRAGEPRCQSTPELVVKGGFGGGIEADAGQYISVIDLDGQQAGDFVALNRHDLTEGLSAVRSRRHLLSLYFRVGDRLLSSRDRPMLEVVADSVGIHDATVPACDPTRYSVDFGVDGHRNCLENMHEPLAPYGVDILDVPEPFNLFQNSPVVGDGRTGVVDPPSKAGDRVVFRALMDVVCALSPCPQDIIPGNGLAVSDIHVVVSDTAPEE